MRCASERIKDIQIDEIFQVRIEGACMLLVSMLSSNKHDRRGHRISELKANIDVFFYVQVHSSRLGEQRKGSLSFAFGSHQLMVAKMNGGPGAKYKKKRTIVLSC